MRGRGKNSRTLITSYPALTFFLKKVAPEEIIITRNFDEVPALGKRNLCYLTVDVVSIALANLIISSFWNKGLWERDVISLFKSIYASLKTYLIPTFFLFSAIMILKQPSQDFFTSSKVHNSTAFISFHMFAVTNDGLYFTGNSSYDPNMVGVDGWPYKIERLAPFLRTTNFCFL